MIPLDCHLPYLKFRFLLLSTIMCVIFVVVVVCFVFLVTFYKVAMKHPSAVTACNLDLENLITDSNRSIATLAITTLLKTGSESSVDRLMKQISSFVSEISDEFKVRI